MMENRDEKIVEESNEKVEKEETVDDLVKEKADNEFIARENTAQIQIFVQNANFDNKTDIKQVLELANLNVEGNKKYNLQKMEECTEFFTTCKSKEYITLAIVLSIFEIVPIGDYADLKDTLIEYLPNVSQLDKEGNEINMEQTNSYISLNSALSVVGGKIFITDDGQQCIGYGNSFEKIFSNIWIQFPNLRKPIISWLLRINDVLEYKTSFEVYQIVGAFIRIMIEDFQYAKRQVFDRLYSRADNLGLLARLAQELLRNERLKTDILNIVFKWMESESNWLWKSALLVCLHTYNLDIDRKLHKAMVHAVKKRMFGFQNSDLKFIVLFAGNAKNVRTIMSFHIWRVMSMRGIELYIERLRRE